MMVGWEWVDEGHGGRRISSGGSAGCRWMLGQCKEEEADIEGLHEGWRHRGAFTAMPELRSSAT